MLRAALTRGHTRAWAARPFGSHEPSATRSRRRHTAAHVWQVTEGLDVLRAIEGVQTDGRDKPKTPVVMETIEIVD